MASTKFEVSMEIFKFQGEPDVSVTLTGKSPTELDTALKTLETIAKTTTLYDGDSGTYGKDAQLTKAVEEMSELTKALCKLKEGKRKYDTPYNREMQEVYSNIEEEIADVFIMLVQLFAIFNPHELVNITKIVWDKLDRLKDNLDKEAAKKEGYKDVTPEC